MEATEIFNVLKAYISSELLAGQDAGLNETTPLLEWGLLDSLTIVSLLAHIETKLGIHIPDEEVRPENFQNLGTLTKLVLSQLDVKEVIMDTTVAQSNMMLRILTSYGIKEDTITFADYQYHLLQTSGNAPLWLMLPALGNHSTSWGEILRAMAGEQAAIAVDLLGFGLSHCTKQIAPTYADQVAGIAKLLEQLNPDKIVLVGNSLAAMLATEIVRQQPQRIKALVIVSFGLISNPGAWWQELSSISDDFSRFLEYTYYRPPHLSPSLQSLLKEALSQPAYDSFLDEHGLAAMETAFDKITVPTLFICGEDDRVIPPQVVTAAASRIPLAQVKVLARCGHFPQTERPQEFLALTRSFLNTLVEGGTKQ